MISEKIQNWAKIIGTIGIIGFYTMSTYLSTKENKEGIEKLELDIHKDFELRDSRSDKRHKRMLKSNQLITIMKLILIFL